MIANYFKKYKYAENEPAEPLNHWTRNLSIPICGGDSWR